ncbi:MAG TPA: glycosyltransferase family 2 protein [Lachnospiraceae bacterium]|nr:glycosyltransferase family 2 protein [Lachnospiraceae bacterium]
MKNADRNKYSLAVIISNYNKSGYLRECLNSVLQQTLLPDEIIVVDDCSTDDSREIISEYAGKYNIIRLLFLEKNGGVSNARNMGLKEAGTAYVTFIDSDDFYYNKDKLENEMRLIKKYSAMGRDILSYSVSPRTDADGVLLPKERKRKWGRLQFITGKSFMMMVSMAKRYRLPRDYCIKKEVLLAVGAYSFYKDFYEDMDLLMRIAESGTEFYCTYEYGSVYRQTGTGLSNRKDEENKNTLREIRQEYYLRLSAQEKIECTILFTAGKIRRFIKKQIAGFPGQKTE